MTLEQITENMPLINIIEGDQMADDMPEHERARAWREAMKMSRPDVAKATGFGLSSIIDFESGRYRSTGKPVPADAMKRYKLACAAVTMRLNFDWRSVSIDLVEDPQENE